MSRPYTPIVPPGSRDKFYLLVKDYDHGNLSSSLYRLGTKSMTDGAGSGGKDGGDDGGSGGGGSGSGRCSENMKVFMRGPKGGFPQAWLDGAEKIVMIGAGTGIAPMLQVSRYRECVTVFKPVPSAPASFIPLSGLRSDRFCTSC